MKATWKVVVVYEDEAAREQAVKFCDELVQNFWTKCELDFSWCSFSSLKEKAGNDFAAKAAEAHAIVFASSPDSTMPNHVEEWMQLWLRGRGEREGILIGLNDPGADLEGRLPGKYAYLRSVALRAGMDYLNHAPQDFIAIPNSPESCTERARQVTSVLHEILRRPAPPKSMLS